jgi:hypothetical protein
MTTEEEFVSCLQGFFEDNDVNGDEAQPWTGAGIKSVRTYEEAMILTHNRGLVVNLVDGTQFQVTIVQSR